MSSDICKLCKKESVLRHSHILPEFFYLNLYDEKHRAVQTGSNQDDKFVQKGIREYLLCQECETKLSKYEGYASKLIKNIPNFSRGTNDLFVFSEDVNYQQFKLFQLSILWRASVSKQTMFSNVNLRQEEEKIRLMLNDENPGKSSDYGCLMIRVPEPKTIDKILWSPIQEKVFGYKTYRFSISNLFWYFFITRGSVRNAQAFFLQETGILRVWTSRWSETELVSNMTKALDSKRKTNAR